jgi:hypothetical protein
MLPRSNRRNHIRRWPALAKKIDCQIRSIDYKDTVLRCLSIRTEVRDPTPYYLALMVVSDLSRPILSDGAIASCKKLRTQVGANNVGIVSVRTDSLLRKQVRITSAWVNFS